MALPSVTMEARVVADPELRFAPSGTAVLKIRCVASSRKKNEAGEWVDDKTCWLNVTAFNKLAENSAESVTKGALITVTGRLQTDEWTDRETGEKKSSTSVLADAIGVSLAVRTVSATSQVQRSSAPASEDPWASGPPAGQQAGSGAGRAAGGDLWGGGPSDQPPF